MGWEGMRVVVFLGWGEGGDERGNRNVDMFPQEGGGWMTYVQTIPAEVPESKSARAKTVPAAGDKVEESRSWIPKREAVDASGLPYREAPATMRMAELTNRAKVKSEVESSTIEYLRQLRMTRGEGWYFSDVSVPRLVVVVVLPVVGGGRRLAASSNWRRRGWTMPEPRKRECGITVAPRMPQD